MAANDSDLVFILNIAVGGNLQYGIDDLATRSAYDAVFWKAWNVFTPTNYPSILLMDFIGPVRSAAPRSFNISYASCEAVALVMAVNSGRGVQDCYVGGGSTY